MIFIILQFTITHVNTLNCCISVTYVIDVTDYVACIQPHRPFSTSRFRAEAAICRSFLYSNSSQRWSPRKKSFAKKISTFSNCRMDDFVRSKKVSYELKQPEQRAASRRTWEGIPWWTAVVSGCSQHCVSGGWPGSSSRCWPSRVCPRPLEPWLHTVITYISGSTDKMRAKNHSKNRNSYLGAKTLLLAPWIRWIFVLSRCWFQDFNTIFGIILIFDPIFDTSNCGNFWAGLVKIVEKSGGIFAYWGCWWGWVYVCFSVMWSCEPYIYTTKRSY